MSSDASNRVDKAGEMSRKLRAMVLMAIRALPWQSWERSVCLPIMYISLVEGLNVKGPITKSLRGRGDSD